MRWELEYRPPRGEKKKSHVVQQCFVPTSRVHDFIEGMQCGRDGAQCRFQPCKENRCPNLSRDGHKTALDFTLYVTYCHSILYGLFSFQLPCTPQFRVVMKPFDSRSYKCEYGPKDFSHIVEELLPKPRKKKRPPDSVPEGNEVAPTCKARARGVKDHEGRKPAQRLNPKP